MLGIRQMGTTNPGKSKLWCSVCQLFKKGTYATYARVVEVKAGS